MGYICFLSFFPSHSFFLLVHFALPRCFRRAATSPPPPPPDTHTPPPPPPTNTPLPPPPPLQARTSALWRRHQSLVTRVRGAWACGCRGVRGAWAWLLRGCSCPLLRRPAPANHTPIQPLPPPPPHTLDLVFQVVHTMWRRLERGGDGGGSGGDTARFWAAVARRPAALAFFAKYYRHQASGAAVCPPAALFRGGGGAGTSGEAQEGEGS